MFYKPTNTYICMTKSFPTIKKRKIIKSGNSLVVTLPKEWLEDRKLSEGDELMMIVDEDIQIKEPTDKNIDKLKRGIEISSVISED